MQIPILGSALDIEFTDRGVSDVPEYFSTKMVEAVVIKGHEHAFPEHVQAQIRQRRKVLRELFHHYLTRAINSDRYNLARQLRAMGMHEAADYIETEKITL